jgi:predicted nucleic acid-binding protein
VGLIDDAGVGPVGIDTSIFIYFIEETPRYVSTIDPLFAGATEGKFNLVTSALTLMEVLVVPYRTRNDVLAQRYEALLTRSRGVRVIDITRDDLRVAAQLRSSIAVTTPDALQLAAALGAKCTAFVTNDRRLPSSVSGLRIVQLGAYAT